MVLRCKSFFFFFFFFVFCFILSHKLIVRFRAFETSDSLQYNFSLRAVVYCKFESVHCYAPAYSKNSGWALSITPVRPVRLSVRPLSVRPTSCPGHNSQTVWNIFMKLHRCIHHIETMCHEQGRQLLYFWFLNYFRLT